CEFKRGNTEIHSVQHESARRIDDPGDSNTDARHLADAEPDLEPQLSYAVDDGGNDSVIAVAACPADAAHDLAGPVQSDSIRLGSADVQAHTNGPAVETGRARGCHYETPSCPDSTMTAAPRSTMSSCRVRRITTSSNTPSSVRLRSV